MLRVMIALVVLAATVYALVDALQSSSDRVQVLPKFVWVALIVLIPVLGPAAWIFLGRPVAGAPGSGRRERPRGPDDDPDFLRKL